MHCIQYVLLVALASSRIAGNQHHPTGCECINVMDVFGWSCRRLDRLNRLRRVFAIRHFFVSSGGLRTVRCRVDTKKKAPQWMGELGGRPEPRTRVLLSGMRVPQRASLKGLAVAGSSSLTRSTLQPTAESGAQTKSRAPGGGKHLESFPILREYE